MKAHSYTHAIVRVPGRDFSQGITTAGLGTPDYDLMLEQHQSYIGILRKLGLEVTILEPLPGYPDAYFVEDVAVVTPHMAVITNPGTPARSGETPFIEPALSRFRSLHHITSPGTLDGGDVLAVGGRYFIGLSGRTNRAGAEQLGGFLETHGYTWGTVEVSGGLHLKSFVNYAGQDTLLLNQKYAHHRAFKPYQKIILQADEAPAANSMWINDTIVMPVGFPAVKEKLASRGFPVIELDMSEARKMDGGLTCMSLRFEAQGIKA